MQATLENSLYVPGSLTDIGRLSERPLPALKEAKRPEKDGDYAEGGTEIHPTG